MRFSPRSPSVPRGLPVGARRPLAAGLALLFAAGLTARLAGEEAAPARSNGKPTVVIKRLHKFTEEELRKQLLQVPEVDLDQDPKRSTSARLVRLAAKSEAEQHFQRVRLLRHERLDLAALSLRIGPECRLDQETASALDSCSSILRRHMGDAGTLREELLGPDSRDEQGWLRPRAVPALAQMLQVEGEATRLLL